jgi:hypothetical protein
LSVMDMTSSSMTSWSHGSLRWGAHPPIHKHTVITWHWQKWLEVKKSLLLWTCYRFTHKV